MLLQTQSPQRKTRFAAALCAGVCAAPLAFGSAFAQAPAPAKAPAAARPADSDNVRTLSEVIVIAEPLGEAVGDIKADTQLNSEDVAALGVSTMSDLIDALAPQLGSTSGRGGEPPAILLNGRRISSFNEIRTLPAEAILRVDILPEEAALKYGFSANQRVANIVLKSSFGSELIEIDYGGSAAGGGLNSQSEAGVTRIAGDRRFNIDLKYNTQDSIAEAERDVIPLTTAGPYALGGNLVSAASGAQIDPALSALVGRPVTVAGIPVSIAGRAATLADFAATAGTANTTNIGLYRTLVPETRKTSLNAVYTQLIFAGINATVNVTLDKSSSDSLRGLPTVALQAPTGNPFSPFAGTVQVDRYVDAYGPLKQGSESQTQHVGLSLNRDLAGWRIAATGNYDHSESASANDRGVTAAALQAAVTARSASVNPFAPFSTSLLALAAQDTGNSETTASSALINASGSLFRLPAGQARLSFRLGASGSEFSSQSVRSSVLTNTSFSRNGVNGQANIDLPLTSRANHVLEKLGDIGLNANVAVDDYSDTGTLSTYGYGVRWSPIARLNLIASQTHDQSAPTQQQLGNPLLLTPGSRIYDYRTGATVDVTQVSGGNPALVADDRNRTSLRLSWQPWAAQQFNIRADYNKIRVDNPIATFPAASAAIEAAFPNRFARDASGNLTQVDFRPVNFARQDASSLRWGFDWSRAIGPQQQAPPRGPGGAFGALAAAGVLPGGGRPGQGAPQGGRAPGAQGAAPGGAQAANGQARPQGQGQPQGQVQRQGQGQAQAQAANRQQDGGGAFQGPPPGAGGFNGPPEGAQTGGGGFQGGGAPGGGGGAPGGGGGPGGGGPGGGGAQDGRLRVSLFHTYYFENQFLVRQGGPVLDFLDGASLSGMGGQPRHEVQAQVNAALFGIGGQLNLNWKSGTQVRGGSTGDLDFSDITKVNARIFLDFNQRKTLIGKFPILKGSRMSFGVNNIFDQQIKVTDPKGATPVSFQPAYLDPQGRTWQISFRKLFS